MRTQREAYTDLIYMGNRKRQVLLSKFWVLGTWARVEVGRGEEGRGAMTKLRVQ